MALVGAGGWDDQRARLFRREAAAGLAAVAETREDWTAAQKHLTALLELDPANGQARHAWAASSSSSASRMTLSRR